MADVGMASLSVFLMQSPSFLGAPARAGRGPRAVQRAHPVRAEPRPVRQPRPARHAGVPHARRRAGGALRRPVPRPSSRTSTRTAPPIRCAASAGRVLVALDGTEYFRSRSIHCGNCSTRRRSDGGTEHYHQMLAANLKSHQTLYEYLDGIRLPTLRRTAGRGAKRRIHRYRWMTGLPVSDGDDAPARQLAGGRRPARPPPASHYERRRGHSSETSGGRSTYAVRTASALCQNVHVPMRYRRSLVDRSDRGSTSATS